MASNTTHADLIETTEDERFMQVAIDACVEGIGHGESCFGACVVREGRLVVAAYNDNTGKHWPTRHAEVNAIEQACEALGRGNLEGCTFYATCEPCPNWAGVERIVFGATIQDAMDAGIGQLTVTCEQMRGLGHSPVTLTPCVLREECTTLFERWKRAGR